MIRIKENPNLFCCNNCHTTDDLLEIDFLYKDSFEITKSGTIITLCRDCARELIKK